MRHRKTKSTVFSVVITVCSAGWLGGSVAHAEVYRWVDKDGRVHFSDRPRAGAETVKIRPASPRSTNTGEVLDEAARRDKQRRVLNAYQKDREERRATRAKSQAEQDKLAERCKILEKRIGNANNARFLYRKGEDGQKQVLSNEDRAEYVAKLRDAADSYCP